MLERIQKELKEGMKARDGMKVSVLRLLLSEFKNEKIKLGRDLEDEEALALVKRAAKKREEAAREYEKGGRPELAEKERGEKKILEAYLPAQLGREEVERLVEETIKELGASSPKDMGRIMGAVMKEHRAEVDGALVREVAAKKLEPPAPPESESFFPFCRGP
jgi:uncharacterized protein YqeY